jgi:type VI secretion system protein ImpJ
MKELMVILLKKLNEVRDQLARSDQAFKEHYGPLSETYFDLKEMDAHGLTHPRELYRCLAKLVMKLGLIRGSIINLEPYNHQIMGECLHAVRDLLKKELNEEIETLPSYCLQKGLHAYPSVENIDAEYLQGYSWYLGIDFSHHPQESILKFPAQAKLGTIKTLDQMIAAALPGIRLSHQLRAPKQIRGQEGYEYFKLDQEGADWKHVKEERSFMAYLPASLQNKKITLDIVKD